MARHADTLGAEWTTYAQPVLDIEEVDPGAPRSHPMLDVVRLSAEVDRSLRLGNHARLSELARLSGGEVDIISAHGPWEFQRSAR
ncbi:hypothetical protein ABZ260_12845 [Streptosporangium sp. NPDC006013]|uniref:hypothetical protein n=1 Tax=Streptosporangium sp. NPDC006013 TaxID=3155596 RepID=UPI0033A50511